MDKRATGIGLGAKPILVAERRRAWSFLKMQAAGGRLRGHCQDTVTLCQVQQLGFCEGTVAEQRLPTQKDAVIHIE